MGLEERPQEAVVKVIRMLVLVLFIALLGGAFGAGIGGLVGYGFPRTIAGQYEVQDRTIEPNSGETGQTVSKGAKIAVGEGDDWSTARKGAALGGAIGLIAGLVLGIPLALMDQFVAQIVEWMAGRKEGRSGAPGDPDSPESGTPSRGDSGVGSP